jgi:hypothetical protein
MNKRLQQAMRISRTTRPLPTELTKILAAEQRIAQMTVAELADVRCQLAE